MADEHDDIEKPLPSSEMYGFLDKFKRQPDDEPQQDPRHAQWLCHREEFKTDRKKLKAFLELAAQAAGGPYTERRKPDAKQRLDEFAFLFGKDTTPQALCAGLELAEVWGLPKASALPFIRQYATSNPDFENLWGAVRGRGAHGQYRALTWRVIRPMSDFKWIPPDTSEETIQAAPDLHKEFVAAMKAVRSAMTAADRIRQLQEDRVKRHTAAQSELDAISSRIEEAGNGDNLLEHERKALAAKWRTAETRLLRVPAGIGMEVEAWRRGDTVMDESLIQELERLRGLAFRLESHCKLIDELLDGSQPNEVTRSAKNLHLFSRVAGALVLAVARELPDPSRRQGRWGNAEGRGYGRKEVLARTRQILESIYPQFMSGVTDTSLKALAQRVLRKRKSPM
jgi:hypothetical protein